MVRKCRMYPVPLPREEQFAWEWKAEDGDEASGRAFRFFYECMQDAHNRGFDVDIPALIAELKRMQ